MHFTSWDCLIFTKLQKIGGKCKGAMTKIHVLVLVESLNEGQATRDLN